MGSSPGLRRAEGKRSIEMNEEAVCLEANNGMSSCVLNVVAICD